MAKALCSGGDGGAGKQPEGSTEEVRLELMAQVGFRSFTPLTISSVPNICQALYKYRPHFSPEGQVLSLHPLYR